MSTGVKKTIKFVLEVIMIFTVFILEPSLNSNKIMRIIESCIALFLGFLVIEYFFPKQKND